MYKCTDYYDASDEAGLAWDDPTVGVDWPLARVRAGGSPEPEVPALSKEPRLLLCSSEAKPPPLSKERILFVDGREGLKISERDKKWPRLDKLDIDFDYNKYKI